MVMAAGLGTRLRPITHEIPKPVVPVCNRPIVEHLVRLLAGHGVHEVIANLHWFPETVEAALRDVGELGVEMSYRREEELLGTAGGVRNVADFLTAGGDDVFLVLAGDALTDADLTALAEAHRANGGVATLGVTKVADVSEYGVIISDADGRIQGFQEKPDPAEALSDLGNCGIYVFSPEIFDYFPDRPFADWAQDVFPALLENDVPFYVHEIDEYWNDVGSLHELKSGTFDALEGRLRIERGGTQLDEGLFVGEGTQLEDVTFVGPPVWVGRDCEIGIGTRLMGPLVIGDNCRIGDTSALRDSIIFPGTDLPIGTILIDAIAGHVGIADSLRQP
jgi:mannose-1-phosphate guanylyltransferase